MDDAGRPFLPKDAPSERAEEIARNRLAQLREDRGWSYSELARRVGTTPTQIRKLETGVLNISLSWMQRLARALEQPMSAFLAPEEVNLSIDAETHSVMTVMAGLAQDERQMVLDAAKQVLALARRMARDRSGVALVGSEGLGERVAAKWDGWSDGQRQRAVDLLMAAEGLVQDAR